MSDISHLAIQVTGRVQGVGFRPYVQHLANHLHLTGHVTNNLQGVYIEIAGSQEATDKFKQQLQTEHPPHARIDSLMVSKACTPLGNSFRIIKTETPPSSHHSSTAEIPADLRICDACLEELFNPSNRRYLYPFISCTDCGPRYSSIQNLPYERLNTSMSAFKMCHTCEQEYLTPSYQSRRFHSQANACDTCGPKLSLAADSKENDAINHDAIEHAVQLIRQGRVVAVKGIGGFHLVCDARNKNAVLTLRERKRRPDKPFAIMALNTKSLEQFVELTDESSALLSSPAAPIILMPKVRGCDDKLNHVAPDMSDLGCMLPYTPLHFLLFHTLLGKPEGTSWLHAKSDLVLIMTSANLSGEPIITDNQECESKLAEVADFFLLHDRDILSRCDDSVIQSGSPALMIRRSRGYAPESLRLSKASSSILACGAHLKNTFCLTQNSKAYISAHIGELDSIDSYGYFKTSVTQYLSQFNAKPDAVACDLHPDYFSTRFSEEFAQERNIPLIKVQHHRAHIASVLAEHDFQKHSFREHSFQERSSKNVTKGPILGLVLDGIGLGDEENNNAWGGELFYGHSHDELNTLERIAHLSPIALPGGDKATREIWRIGSALLGEFDFTHQGESHAQRVYRDKLSNPMIEAFISQGQHIMTSSAGRWFDAIASIINIRQTVTFEGQAAMQLEYMARLFGTLPQAQKLAQISDHGTLDLRPIIPSLLRESNIQANAARFHSELIDGLLRWLTWASSKYQTKTIICSGGCFQNRILRSELSHRLTLAGLESFFPEHIPTNDGGISLGQAWIASQNLT